VVELTRSFPQSLASLAATDPEVFSDPRYPLLQTRPGRRRFEEIQALLRGSNDSQLGDELASALAKAITAKTPIQQVVASIAARVPEDERGKFLRLGLDELAHVLRKAGERYPVLSMPRSRGAALAIQDALRNQPGASLSMGWLVRASGPGQRGEVIQLTESRVLLGHGPSCKIRLNSTNQVAEQHAAIDERRGDFFIEPLQGPVKIEDQPIQSRHPIGDGDTIEIGENRYVFKCVTSGATSTLRIKRRP
jgi:hypothetical protein